MPRRECNRARQSEHCSCIWLDPWPCWTNREQCSHQTRGACHERHSTSSPEPAPSARPSRSSSPRPGHRVRLLTRSGSGPEHPLVERRRVDVSRAEQLDAAFDGRRSPSTTASTARGTTPAPGAPSCPSPSATSSPPPAASAPWWSSPRASTPTARSTARSPRTLPRTATHRQARRPHRAARPSGPPPPTPTVSVAASDFYGPLVRNAHAGRAAGADGAGRPDDAGARAASTSRTRSPTCPTSPRP